MLAFSACVAGSFSLGALVAPSISPLALNAPRFALAAMLVALVARHKGGLPLRAFAAPWRYLALGGIFALYFWAMFEGLKTAPAVSASAVFTLTPVISAAFGYLLLRQRMTRRMALALALGGAGALWVIFRGRIDALLAFEVGRGEAIYFLGCVAHALYTPLLARLGRGEPIFAYVFGVLVACAAVLAVLGWRDIAATDWGGLPRIVWLAIVYLAVFASAGTVTLINFAAQRLPAAKVMAYTYLVPSWVILWEIGLGHGGPGAAPLAGVALTALALALLLREEHKEPASSKRVEKVSKTGDSS